MTVLRTLADRYRSHALKLKGDHPIYFVASTTHTRLNRRVSNGSAEWDSFRPPVGRCPSLSSSVELTRLTLPWFLSSSTLHVRCTALHPCVPSSSHSRSLQLACKSVLLKMFSRPMFFQRLLDLVVSSEWFLRFSKLCAVMMFADVPFPSCFSVCF